MLKIPVEETDRGLDGSVGEKEGADVAFAPDPMNLVGHAVGFQFHLHLAEVVGVHEGVLVAVKEKKGRAGRGDVVYGGCFVEKFRHLLQRAAEEIAD